MSRIGRMPVEIPAGVKIDLDGSAITVKGPKGTLSMVAHKDIVVRAEGDRLLIERPSDSKTHKSLHGLTRSLVQNMVTGVSVGFEKALEVSGVGYKATKSGKKLTLSIGYSHLVEMEDPDGITVEVPAPTKIIVKGCDKQLVGETAAKIRAKRVPDAYQGKGIKYATEVLKLKEGKTGGKAK
jgi:large subunit ribosomal protein L6